MLLSSELQKIFNFQMFYRYATFLEMYVQLHVDEEKVDKTGKNVTTDEELKTRVWQIWSHEEGFFKEQRRLKVIEGPMLKSIRESVKSVKDGKCRGGKWVYQPAYSKVFDQVWPLNHFLFIRLLKIRLV